MAKVLTIKQPWAALIVLGVKDIENRSWQSIYRGRLLIHSSSKPDKIQLSDILPPDDITYELVELSKINGYIVGEVQLIDCIDPGAYFKSGWHEPGYYGWYLEKPKLIVPPVKCKGKLGIWYYDCDEML